MVTEGYTDWREGLDYHSQASCCTPLTQTVPNCTDTSTGKRCNVVIHYFLHKHVASFSRGITMAVKVHLQSSIIVMVTRNTPLCHNVQNDN